MPDRDTAHRTPRDHPPADGSAADGAPDLELEAWHGEPVAAWQERWGVPALRVFRRVGSTNDVARALAVAGAPAGTLVVAEEQTRGRGQRGRVWRSPPGTSLALSMVLRPGSTLGGRVLTLRLGLAAARALDDALSLDVQLKWPNDLLVPTDRGLGKVGGILCEGSAEGRRFVHVVAGIGVNLRTPDDGWPEAIAGRAASLRDAAGRDVAAPAVAGAIARAWLEAGTREDGPLSARERRAFEERDALRGRAITVDGAHAGTVLGITATGALRVHGTGGDREVQGGSVRPADDDTEQGERG